jgi:hypothetical protein
VSLARGRLGATVRRRRFSEHRRFLALQACWSILRGESVAWKLGLAGDSRFEALGRGLFTAGCTVNGEPLTAWHLAHGDPEAQET